MNRKYLFEVGDTIVVKTWCGTYKHIVTRVTKTMAVCECNKPDVPKCTCRYKRYYYLWNEDTKRANVTPLPRIEWNTNEYFVNPK